MPTNKWRGDAQPVAQVETFTVGSSTNGQTFGIAINGKVISYTAGAAETPDTIAAALQALLDQTQIPEFREVAWTVAAAVITATAATPGVPFTTATTGTGTLTKNTVIASTGPSHVDEPANWSLGTLPAAAEDVLIAGGADLLYGLGILTPAAYASLRITASFTGAIGLPIRAVSGTGYVEYRPRFFPVASAVPVTIGAGDGDGPSRVYLDVDTSLNLTVVKTAARPSPSVPVVNVINCTAGTLTVTVGDVALAGDDDATVATVASATVGDAALTIGPGATVTTLDQVGGTVVNHGTVGTLGQVGGSFTHYGTISTAITADPEPGSTVTFDWRTGGTIPTVTFRGQGPGQTAPVLNCAADPRPKTVTNGTFTGGARLDDPDGTVVMTNPQNWDRVSLAASDLGSRFTLTRTPV